MTKVAIICDGVRQVHAIDTTGNYATLCGLDGNDEFVRQMGADLEGDKDKIDCPQCWSIWVTATRYKRRDFVSNIPAL